MLLGIELAGLTALPPAVFAVVEKAVARAERTVPYDAHGGVAMVPDPIRKFCVRVRTGKSRKLFVDTEFKRYAVSTKTGRVRCVGLLSELASVGNRQIGS